MTTVLKIVTRSLRKIGVAAMDETPTADETENAVDALNAMIHAFKLEGVDLEWSDQISTDEFALDPEYHEGIVYLLASRMNPDYTIPPSFNADDWWRSIQANNVTAPTAVVPLALRRMVGNLRRGNTYGGS